MYKEAMGNVISVAKQWWLKINTKPIRMHALDGAAFPHIIKVQYTVDGTEYVKRKWISAGKPVPAVRDLVKVRYSTENPGKAEIVWPEQAE